MFSVFVAALCRTRIQYCWMALPSPSASSTPYLILFTLSRLVITILIIIINKYKILNNRLKYLLNYLQYLFLFFARPTKSRWTFQFALSFFKEGLPPCVGDIGPFPDNFYHIFMIRIFVRLVDSLWLL